MKEVDLLLAMKGNGYVTARQLAAQLQVSEKTIRNMIQSLRDEVKEYGAHIHSQTKLGYELKIIDEEKFLSFIHQLQNQNAESLESTGDRIQFILRTFLEHCGEYIKLDDLAERLHVSKSCINRDIKEVKRLLQASHLELESRPYYGLRIIGEEYALRACIAEYQIHKSKGSGGVVEFHHVVLQKIIDCAKQVLKKYDFQINEFQFQNLVMHLLIALIRIKNGNYLSIDVAQYEELARLKEYEMAGELRRQLEKAMQMSIPSDEDFYITIHLATKKNMLAVPSDQRSIVVSDQVQQVVNRIVDHIDKTYSLNLKGDIDLVMALYFHFVTLDIRLRYAMNLSNPILEDIKQKYQPAFLIAQSCNQVIRDFYPQCLNEDELAYIALHLELAMERQRKGCEKKNILIICSTGSGTSRLLKYEYEKRFRNYVQDIYTADPSELSRFDFDKVDYIFSTIQTDIPVSKPVILINPILERDDIKNIAQAMREESKIRSFFRKELFFDHIQGDTAEAVIKEMVGRIARVETLPADFEVLIREREKLGVTSFKTGVAFPHPNRPCTDHTFVAVGILDKRVLWKSNRVRMVYLFALTKEKTREEHLPGLYQITGELLSDEERIQDIVEKRSYDNFIRHILEMETAGG